MTHKFYTKLFLSLVFFLIWALQSKTQISEGLLKLIDNKNIAYEMALTRPQTYNEDEISVSIEIIHISSFDLDSLLQKNDRVKLIYSLIKLFDDPNHDWGANLLLYAITRQLAFTIIMIKSEDKWRKSFKEKDLENWRSFFAGIMFSKKWKLAN
jgi:hypothetical protein